MSTDASPSPDFQTAHMALFNPATPAAVLAQIAEAHPQLRAGVPAHPNCYPALLDWLDALGDPAVSQAVAARRAISASAVAAPVAAATLPGVMPSQMYQPSQMNPGAYGQAAQMYQSSQAPQPSQMYQPPQMHQPNQMYPGAYGQLPYGVQPKQRRSGKLIGLIVAVLVLVVGLLVWLVILPAVRGGGGGSDDPDVKRAPVVLQRPSGWSQAIDLSAAFDGSSSLNVTDAMVGNVVAITDDSTIVGVDLLTKQVLWTDHQDNHWIVADDSGTGLVIQDSQSGGNLLVIDQATGLTMGSAPLKSSEMLVTVAAGIALTASSDGVLCARALASIGTCKWSAKELTGRRFIFGKDRWFNTANGVVNWADGTPASFGADAGRTNDDKHVVYYTVGSGSDLATRVVGDQIATNTWTYTLQHWDTGKDKAAGAAVVTGDWWWVPGPLIVGFDYGMTAIHAYNKDRGNHLWDFGPQTGKLGKTIQRLVGNSLVISDDKDGFYALNIDTGQQEFWTDSTKYSVIWGPYASRMLYATDDSPTTLYAFDGNSASFARIWSTPLPSEMDKGKVYAMARHIFAVSSNQAQLWVLNG